MESSAATQVTSPTVRVLPPEDWERLRDFEPFNLGGLPDPAAWRIIVAEQGGVGGPIVAFVCLWGAIHCEPAWFDPAVRHHPKLFLGLWSEARRVLTEEIGAQMVFSTIDDDKPELQALWERFGFIRGPGRQYVGDLDRLPK